ncbi:hypothetical protein ACFQY7_18440 [Actinomadura luteofluorescens]|uniref:hypothetical protein n=1 Tax=Actinomadura luteofluorescens TaxID=46163 RepID=UPI00363B2A71
MGLVEDRGLALQPFEQLNSGMSTMAHPRPLALTQLSAWVSPTVRALPAGEQRIHPYATLPARTLARGVRQALDAPGDAARDRGLGSEREPRVISTRYFCPTA